MKSKYKERTHEFIRGQRFGGFESCVEGVLLEEGYNLFGIEGYALFLAVAILFLLIRFCSIISLVGLLLQIGDYNEPWEP